MSDIDLIDRLLQQLITVPRPDSRPRPKEPCEYITITLAQFGDHKPGDSAGLRSIDFHQVQEFVYAIEPVCLEAANEIRRLRALVRDCRQWYLRLLTGE